MTLTQDEQLILLALSHQPSGYLAAPHAACFAQFRIASPDVETALLSMAAEGNPLVDYVIVDAPVLDPDGAELLDEQTGEPVMVTVDAGWEITDAGRGVAEAVNLSLDDQLGGPE